MSQTFFLKNDNGTFTMKDGIGTVYPIEIEYGDFGKRCSEFVNFPILNKLQDLLTPRCRKMPEVESLSITMSD